MLKVLKKLAHKVATLLSKKHKDPKTGKKLRGRFTWVLDAGHGGLIDGKYQTKGKRSPIWPDGKVYYEGVGNREIVRGIIEEIKQKYPWIVTLELVPSELDVPLSDRSDYVNELHEELGNVILQSHHSNGFKHPRGKGWEGYTYYGETPSDYMMEKAYDIMENYFPGSTFRTDMSDGDKDKEASLHMVRETNCIAGLFEHFFMTNPIECRQILMNKEGQNKIIFAMVELIVNLEQDPDFKPYE